MHETQTHEQSCFITATYDKHHLPPDGGLQHRDWQLFAKSLRGYMVKRNKTDSTRPTQFRYYMVGEYGETTFRPHFHSLIWGIDFSDSRIPYKKNANGDQLYVSGELTEIWGKGQILIGDLTQETANYCTSYVTKKLNGDLGDAAYERVNTSSTEIIRANGYKIQQGEIFDVPPPYARMSLRPGIGHEWFKRYITDVYPHDIVVNSKGHLSKPPAYYDELLRKLDPNMHESIKTLRLTNKDTESNTLARLEDRAKIIDYKQQQKLNREPNPTATLHTQAIPTQLNTNQQANQTIHDYIQKTRTTKK